MTDAKLFYGVWVPGQGWLKVNGAAIAFDDKRVAKSTARRVRNNARVEFIDEALRDLEAHLLNVEEQQKETGIHKIIKAVWRR